MSASAQRVLAAERPTTLVPSSIWVPLLGAAWVAANLLLIALGAQTSLPLVWSLIAGVLNGAILSVVAVAKASARFQSGTTGLLGGMTLSGFRNDGSIIAHVVGALHQFVDNALQGMPILGDELLHDRIVRVVVYTIWTTILVLMASLVVQWVKDARREQTETR